MLFQTNQDFNVPNDKDEDISYNKSQLITCQSSLANDLKGYTVAYTNATV